MADFVELILTVIEGWIDHFTDKKDYGISRVLIIVGEVCLVLMTIIAVVGLLDYLI